MKSLLAHSTLISVFFSLTTLATEVTAQVQQLSGYRDRFAIANQPIESTFGLSPKPQTIAGKSDEQNNSVSASTDDYLKSARGKIRVGDFQGAIADYTEAIRIKPRDDAYIERGDARKKLSDFQGAIADYNESIRINSDMYSSGKAYYSIARVYSLQNNLDLALDNLHLARYISGNIGDFIFKSTTLKNEKDFDNIRAENRFQSLLKSLDYISVAREGVPTPYLDKPIKSLFAYNEAIHLDPNSSEAYDWRAGVKEYLKDFQGAIADYNELIRLLPPKLSSSIYIRRGDAKAKAYDFQGAIADYTEAIVIKPRQFKDEMQRVLMKQIILELAPFDNSYFSLNMAYINRGIAKVKLGNFQEGISDFDEAIRRDPKSAEAYSNRGIAKRELGDLKGAIADCDQAILFSPSYADGYINRAIVRKESGDLQGASTDENKANHLRAEESWRLGQNSQVYKFFRAAINHYTESIRLEQISAYGGIGVGIELDKESRQPIVSSVINGLPAEKSGIRIQDLITEIDGKPTQGMHVQTVSSLLLGDPNTEVTLTLLRNKRQTLRTTIRRTKFLSDTFISSHLGRAGSKYGLGDFQGAIADYTEIIRISSNPSKILRISPWGLRTPSDMLISAYSSRGSAKSNLSDFQGAITDYSEAIRLDPKNAIAYTDRGNVKQRLGDLSGAIADYNAAINADPKYWGAYYDKACYYSLQNNVEFALENLQIAIKLSRESMELAKTDRDFDNIRSDSRFQSLLK